MSVIKLLDNSLWDKDKLLHDMQSDDFYYGYLGKAALSSSSIKLLLDSPRTYYNVTKYSNTNYLKSKAVTLRRIKNKRPIPRSG